MEDFKKVLGGAYAVVFAVALLILIVTLIAIIGIGAFRLVHLIWTVTA